MSTSSVLLEHLEVVLGFEFVEKCDESLRSGFCDPVEENRFGRPDKDAAIRPDNVRNPYGQAVKRAGLGSHGRAHRQPRNHDTVDDARLRKRHRNLELIL